MTLRLSTNVPFSTTRVALPEFTKPGIAPRQIPTHRRPLRRAPTAAPRRSGGNRAADPSSIGVLSGMSSELIVSSREMCRSISLIGSRVDVFEHRDAAAFDAPLRRKDVDRSVEAQPTSGIGSFSYCL